MKSHPEAIIFFYFAKHHKLSHYNNHIINNKSDKSKILNLRMTAHHCQWRRANALLPVTSLCKRATGSGVFF
jgi:hypothetical protein